MAGLILASAWLQCMDPGTQRAISSGLRLPRAFMVSRAFNVAKVVSSSTKIPVQFFSQVGNKDGISSGCPTPNNYRVDVL